MIGARTAAWIVDLLLYAVLIIGVLGPTPLSPLAEYSKVPDGMSMDTACERVGDLADDVSSCFLIGDRVYFTDSSDAAIQIVGWLAYVGLIYIVWQGLTGLTPGKLLFGLRTVGEDGKAPGMGRAFIRSVLWIVDGFPYCIPGIVGFVTGLTSSGHRRVGDMAAKTFVVGKGDVGQPVMVAGLTATTGYGTPTVYGAGPGYAQVPSSAPWGTPPAAPGAGVPGAAGAAGWGTPPTAPQPPYGATDARPAPPMAPPYTAPTEATPSGGYPAPPASAAGAPDAPAWAPAAADASATAGLASDAPDPAAFDESSDPTDADLSTGDDAPVAAYAAADADVDSGDSTPAGETAAAAADEDSPGADTEAGSPLTAETVEAPSPTDDAPPAVDDTPAPAPAVTPAPASEPEAAPAPAAPAEATPAATTAGTAPTAGPDVEQTYNPQWDAARGAYIQWDPNRSRWLQWDDTGKEWKPI
ncbi:MAG TPA: RDD family protein [Acidimicrobiales bacterium]|nr:RDD family protein [Acidimicrobiales bacterium]